MVGGNEASANPLVPSIHIIAGDLLTGLPHGAAAGFCIIQLPIPFVTSFASCLGLLESFCIYDRSALALSKPRCGEWRCARAPSRRHPGSVPW